MSGQYPPPSPRPPDRARRTRNRHRSEAAKPKQYLVLHRRQHALAMTEIRDPKRCTQPLYPCALVDDRVVGQLQRFAVIRQHHHDSVLERSLAFEHRDQIAEHRVRYLHSDAIHRPIVRVLLLQIAVRRVGDKIRPVACGQVRDEERRTLVERQLAIQPAGRSPAGRASPRHGSRTSTGTATSPASCWQLPSQAEVHCSCR